MRGGAGGCGGARSMPMIANVDKRTGSLPGGAGVRNMATTGMRLLLAMTFASSLPGGIALAQPSSALRQSTNAKQQTAPGSNAKSASGSGADSSAAPNYDPFHAAQDVEVGQFYLHKGDVDAAIDRFKDAVRLREDWAQPRLLLAQCYEKKHDKATALRYYREYLQVFPNPPDRKKVEKKIAKLSRG